MRRYHSLSNSKTGKQPPGDHSKRKWKELQKNHPPTACCSFSLSQKQLVRNNAQWTYLLMSTSLWTHPVSSWVTYNFLASRTSHAEYYCQALITQRTTSFCLKEINYTHCAPSPWQMWAEIMVPPLYCSSHNKLSNSTETFSLTLWFI